MILVAKGRNDSFVQGVLFKLPPYSVLLNHLYDCTFFLTKLLSFLTQLCYLLKIIFYLAEKLRSQKLRSLENISLHIEHQSVLFILSPL